MSMLAVRLDQLKAMSAIQSQPENYGVNAYNHGQANGLRLALSIMTGASPDYLLEPSEGYKGLGSKARASKAVPPATELGKETMPLGVAPIGPENLGTIDVPGTRGLSSILPDAPSAKKQEPTQAQQPAKKEKTMAKKPKPAPKKPTKAAPRVVKKGKASKKASVRKGAVKRGKGSKARSR